MAFANSHAGSMECTTLTIRHSFIHTPRRCLRNYLKAFCETENNLFTQRKKDKQVVGFAVFEIQEQQANPIVKRQRFFYLDQICVLKSCRRDGLAKKAIEPWEEGSSRARI